MHRNHATDFPTDWVKLRLLTGETTCKVVPQTQLDAVMEELKKLIGFTNCPEKTFLSEIYNKCHRANYTMNPAATVYFTDNKFISRNGQLNETAKIIIIRAVARSPEEILSLVSPYAPTAILKRPITKTVGGDEPPKNSLQPH